MGNRALKIYNIPFGGENVRAQSAPHVPLYTNKMARGLEIMRRVCTILPRDVLRAL